MKYLLYAVAAALGLSSCGRESTAPSGFASAGIQNVTLTDGFWSQKMQQWATVTANDVLDKFEGRHIQPQHPDQKYSALDNFRMVADGHRGTNVHVGPPWYDGLIYETIRGLSDLGTIYPDATVAARLDSITGLIVRAQATEPDGFINTYTQLVEPDHRWGENGGFLRFMHDVYNAGFLVEAAVHRYKATGDTRLLNAAVKMADLMAGYMGEYPKHNVVPAHSGPEEALVKLYNLFKNEPELASKITAEVNTDEYLRLAEFWIDARGHNCGLPNWGGQGNDEAERWIRSNAYADTTIYGNHPRPSFGPYAQDSIPLQQQHTIEGHAVRAVLYLAGAAYAAKTDGRKDYVEAATRLWDNMVGKKMYITGGVGAVSFDEKFGPDYYLPSDAYLETCAAVGSGFLSHRLAELTADSKYMDEYERTLYNGVLTGISLSGDNYTYQNPLNSASHSRWEWHGCPCCPPMFLKFMGEMPGHIYATAKGNLFVNLFAASSADIHVDDMPVTITQHTAYPADGTVKIVVKPQTDTEFTLNIRIPGWARSVENPFNLYTSSVAGSPVISVNGDELHMNMTNGYAAIKRKWKKGDIVTMDMPFEPRYISANDNVADLNGQHAIAVGPLIYCLEGCDNDSLDGLVLDPSMPLELGEPIDGLDALHTVNGTAIDADGNHRMFTAIPYYLLGNRIKGAPYKVWL